jgi:uncharacterized membrane protein
MELSPEMTFRKGRRMKTAMALSLTLALATVCGCRVSSPRGGIMAKEQGFKIQVPRFTVDIKQGDVETVKVSLKRGDYFKQDVWLQAVAPEGLSVDPNDVVVKASDRPEAELEVMAASDAALGKYRISIKGAPTTGQSISAEFTVEVKAR